MTHGCVIGHTFPFSTLIDRIVCSFHAVLRQVEVAIGGGFLYREPTFDRSRDALSAVKRAHRGANRCTWRAAVSGRDTDTDAREVEMACILN